MDLLTQLKRDESSRLTVYDDADGRPIVAGKKVVGHPTIGVGRALDTNGISADEEDYLLANDVARVKLELGKALPWLALVDPIRQAVLQNMAFNLGVAGLLKFPATLSKVKAGDYTGAAQEMLHSAWASQVGDRAVRLSNQMKDGEWQ